MRQLIRHILKENNIKQELKKVIEDDGLFKAADFVGGMTNLKSILKDEPEISSLFDKLTGTIFFYYYMGNGRYMKNMKFPLKYEIIGRKSNNHNTNHWPEINVFYDENKLTPEENDTFKSMIKYLIDETNHSDFDSKKFGNYKLFNVNYFTVKEINGENIDLIGGWDFSNSEVKDIHDKLYDNTESLDESTNSETDPTQKILNFLLRRYKIDEVDLGWTDNPIKLKMIKFDIDGERYSISTFENKRQQIAKILDMLTIHNVIDDIDSNEGKLDPYTQKVVRAVKQFINQVMDNKLNMNESKISDKIKSLLGNKTLTKDVKLINVIVEFINENYSIDFESDKEGDITFYLTNDTGNWIFPPIMKYFPTKKLLNYNWKFAEDIHTWIGDDRLLQPDSKMIGKIFEKLYNKNVNYVFGYSRL